MRVRSQVLWLLVVTFGSAVSVVAQDSSLLGPPPTTNASGEHSRLGRFHLGPFYLTPLLRLGTVGLDTNVFYTPTDRRADFSSSGGPGLRLVMPIKGTLQLATEGSLDYIYFARTVSQRRLNKNARAGLEGGQGARTSIALNASYNESFARPSLEVDERVEQTNKSATATLHRQLFARTSLELGGVFTRTETTAGQDPFLGTDLQRTLTYDVFAGTTELDYALTPKTRLTALGAYETRQYRLDRSRDGRTPRADFGIQTDSDTLIGGRVLVGMQWFIPENDRTAQQRSLHADVDLTWHLSPRMQIGGGYRRALTYTSFVTVTGSPVLRSENTSAFIERELLHNIVLRITGHQLRSRTDQPVRLILKSGETTEQVRNDTTYEAVADLGYRIVSRLWAGGSVGYAQRQSNIADFGIQGLLVGAKINFTP
jgi:hypothetical protein